MRRVMAECIASCLKPSKCLVHVGDYCGCWFYLLSSRDSRRLGGGEYNAVLQDV